MSEWVCGNCKSINRGSAGSCYSCGGSRATVAAPDPTLVQPSHIGDGPGFAALSTAGVGASAAVASAPAMVPGFGDAVAVPAAPPAQPASMSDVLGGVLAGVVAAILATAIWYGVVAATHFQVGIVAIAVGFIVGQGVVFGARRHTSIVLVAVSVVLTLIALAVSEYLIVAHFVSQELGFAVDLVQPPDVFFGVISDSLGADPLTLVFWAIALFQAFVIPWRSIRES
ncbi:MAG TPA: hypothetical protein VK867_01475 [Candidatus Limnocylindrales bacterium]|nr:hypothetical protein [Candidatus Limnocylindrales bacterium]